MFLVFWLPFSIILLFFLREVGATSNYFLVIIGRRENCSGIILKFFLTFCLNFWLKWELNMLAHIVGALNNKETDMYEWLTYLGRRILNKNCIWIGGISSMFLCFFCFAQHTLNNIIIYIGTVIFFFIDIFCVFATFWYDGGWCFRLFIGTILRMVRWKNCTFFSFLLFFFARDCFCCCCCCFCCCSSPPVIIIVSTY